MLVHVLNWEHRYGTDTCVCTTQKMAIDVAVDWVVQTLADDDDDVVAEFARLFPQDKWAAVLAYSEAHDDESITIREMEVADKYAPTTTLEQLNGILASKAEVEEEV